jgi:RND family efflux transporter MFP subunit
MVILRLAFVAALLTSAACGSGSPQAGGPGGAPGGRGGPPPVDMVTLAERPVEQTSELVGTVRSLRTTTVQSQVEGFITAIHVKSGQRVEAGALLFEIDARSQQAAVSALESVRAAREADLTFARQQAERADKLFKAGAMSQQELDQAKALLAAATAQLKAIDEQIKQQRNELGYSKVTASVAGVIGDVPARQGDRITRSTPLTTIEDNSNLELYLNVPVQDATRLRMGLPVRLLNDAREVISTEHITFISPSVDDATQTVLVKTPAGQRGPLRADQFVRARIIWTTAPALTAPMVAVTRIGGQHFVFVAEPASGGFVARQRPIVVGPLVGNDYVVESGLKAGERLIVGGTQRLGDGMPVTEAKKQ